jgi:tetratricopeptide (TPR) repeat protein
MVPYITGRYNRTGFKYMCVRYYRTVERANAVVPRDGRIFFLGGDESYYCGRPLVCPSVCDRNPMGDLARRTRSPGELRALLRRGRITHLIYHEPRADEYASYGIFDWGPEAQKRFIGFWHEYGRLVFHAERVFLFELTDRPQPVRERKTGIPAFLLPEAVRNRVRELQAQATQIFAEGRFYAAVPVAREMVAAAPQLADAHAYLGYSLEQAGNPGGEAATEYRRAIALGYPGPASYFNLGLYLERSRKFGEALDVFEAGLEMEPRSDPLMKASAELAFHLGRMDLAARIYGDLAGSHPGNADYAARAAEAVARARSKGR